MLAALGIDAGEVPSRALRATGIRLDDLAPWTLRRSRLRPLRVTLHGLADSTRLNEDSGKVIEVAWARRRHGRRPLADLQELLWSLLADGGSPAVRILLRLGADLRALRAGLQGWQAGRTARADPGTS